MFKLEITKPDATVEHVYQMNRNEDDFLRFIPGNYGVTKDDVAAYIMDDENFQILENLLRDDQEKRSLDLEETGKIKVIETNIEWDEENQIEVETVTTIHEFVGTLIEWPYDENMNFLGNGGQQ